MSDHECDKEGDCIIPAGTPIIWQPPSWRFSGWDVVGIGLTYVAGLFSVTGQGLDLLSREFAAMAQWKRRDHDERQARAAYLEHQQAIGKDLEAMLSTQPQEES